MVSQKVVIKNPTGLHLRPAGILCKEAMKFKSLITFSFRDNTANAKSVLSVLGACVECGDEIEFTNRVNDEKILTKVIALHIYSCFEDLYRDYDKISLGYKVDEDANPKDMEIYYSKEEQSKYGVVGIEIQLM